MGFGLSISEPLFGNEIFSINKSDDKKDKHHHHHHNNTDQPQVVNNYYINGDNNVVGNGNKVDGQQNGQQQGPQKFMEMLQMLSQFCEMLQNGGQNNQNTLPYNQQGSSATAIAIA